MSFSFDTKNELCKLPVQRRCCAQAEAYGILVEEVLAHVSAGTGVIKCEILAG